jgi:hypothetical protein
MNSTTANSSTVEPTTVEPSSAAFTAFMLKQIRCAKLRAEITANQADMALAALSAGLITPEMAVLVLAECGVEVPS